MVDPVNFTNYNLSDTELEEYVLFGIVAAGKNALTSSRALDRLLKVLHATLGETTWRPFHVISQFQPDNLARIMNACGIGCQTMKARGFHTLANLGLDLRTCTPEDLEQVPGISYKTSRLFILHTRKNARVACLDVHILKWLKSLGYTVPPSSPQKILGT
jgi:endonuclease III